MLGLLPVRFPGPLAEPDKHADDLHRLISALDAGPVDLFATSGGAVNALALVAKHPEQVRTLVAHEPPAAQELPDREPVLAACTDIRQTYQRSGFGPAMAKFIALASYQGPVPAGFADQPAPNPADLGLPAEDDGSRDDPLVGQNMPSCPSYRHDFGAVRTASTRVVVAVGAESAARPWPAGRPSPWPSDWARPPSPSRAATMGSSVANTAAPANQTLSPPPCVRSSPTDGIPRPGRSSAPTTASSRTASPRRPVTA